MSEILPYLLLGLSSVGLAMAIYLADPRSPTTRSLALALGANGWEWIETPWVFVRPLPALAYFDLLLIVTAAIAFAEWLYRVARTAETTPRALVWITRCTRIVQAVSVCFLLWGGLFLEDLYTRFIDAAPLVNIVSDPKLLPFATALGVVTIAYVAGGVILFLQKIDPAEHVRAIALVVAMPFLAAGLALSPTAAMVSNMCGQIVILMGAIRYHALQGERGRFMSKFLSPQVERLVRLRGMAHAMQPTTLEITAVACDLRGFTKYSQCHASQEVVRLLGEYYEAVGVVVAKFGATIKDYAGDGILMLVGAPLPVAEHATIGLTLAREVRDAATGVVRRWSVPQSVLGVGVGVASGVVTAGGIGSASRMEYAAVGPAVNLASRFCSLAADGEILTDARTAELAGTSALLPRGNVAVKGVGDVPHFTLA